MKNKTDMPIEPTQARAQIEQVLGMDDVHLREVIRAIAQAGGMSERRADAITRDADAIRRRLSSVRAEDLQKVLAQISPQQMAQLTEQLQNLKKKED